MTQIETRRKLHFLGRGIRTNRWSIKRRSDHIGRRKAIILKFLNTFERMNLETHVR